MARVQAPPRAGRGRLRRTGARPGAVGERSGAVAGLRAGVRAAAKGRGEAGFNPVLLFKSLHQVNH